MFSYLEDRPAPAVEEGRFGEDMSEGTFADAMGMFAVAAGNPS